MRKTIFLLTVAAAAILAADRPDMSGTWLVDAGHASKLKINTIAIKQSEDSIDLTEGNGSDAKKTVHLTCALGGQQCKIKEAGEEVSFWYNGPALVMMEMRHNNDIVIKTRIEPAEDGKSLKMSVSHISPAGKDETYTLTRSGS